MELNDVLQFAFEAVKVLLTYGGGFAGLASFWTLYKDGVPRVTSEVQSVMYSRTCADQKQVILRIYPGRRSVKIDGIEVEGLDFAVLGDDVSEDTMRPIFSQGRVSVDWEVPSAADDPAPLIKALRISRFNLNSSASISLRIKLRIQSIPFVILHCKNHSMKP